MPKPSDDRTPPPDGSKKDRVLGAVAIRLGVVVAPIQEFFRLEAASGILLFAAAVVALIWTNTPAASVHHRIFDSSLWMGTPHQQVRATLRDAINEGLMTLFFFVVGMEIKRELVGGELRTVRRAMLPAIAAVGGMVVPAALFLAFTWDTPERAGWGIPMATDIAFAIGCLRLLGSRVSQALVVFVTALAIFDDIGGILVIALFYGGSVSAPWLLVAALTILAMALMNHAGVCRGDAYLLVGGALWYAFHQGGIHATIAGVVVGLLIPLRGEGAPLKRLLEAFHPWVAFGIMPLFALANAGVRFVDMRLGDLTEGAALGAAVGLAVGKPLGIVAATALAVKVGIADRPGGATWFSIFGVSVVAGIGFTVALFIAALAYPSAPALLDRAKVGILMGSALAGVAGLLLLRVGSTESREAHRD